MPKMAIVPVEATEEMREEANNVYLDSDGVAYLPVARVQEVHEALTAASPNGGRVSRAVLRRAFSRGTSSYGLVWLSP